MKTEFKSSEIFMGRMNQAEGKILGPKDKAEKLIYSREVYEKLKTIRDEHIETVEQHEKRKY